MKIVNKVIVLVFCVLSVFAQAQSTDKLKKDQEILERKIADTKLLLDKTKSNTAQSLNQLKLINNQVQFREELVRNYDRQVRTAESTIQQKDRQVKELVQKLASLKAQYKKLVIYAYKHRNKYGRLMYIFSSDTYFEAIQRNKYLEKIGDLQKKQFTIIQQHQGLIGREIEEVKIQKEEKILVLNEKKKEKEIILTDKLKQENVYQSFKSEESRLLAELKEDEKKKQLISIRIDAAIKREIALAEEKRKKEAALVAAREAEAKRKAAAALEAAAAKRKANEKSTATSKTAAPASPKEEVESPEFEIAFKETKELELVSKSFESNKGKLPWPVEKGIVTENYGRNAHPTINNVFTNNNGIDISAPQNADARAVFEGEVTSVLNIPGAGKVVILKHGNYRTVYSNLLNTSVNVGDKVKTKGKIGTVLVKPGNNVSILHFEVHQVVGSNVSSLNPVYWISR